MSVLPRPAPNFSLTDVRQGNGITKTPLKSAAVATLAAFALHSAPPCSQAAPINTGACDVSSCVSTGSYMKPSQYLPPMQYAPIPEDVAEQQLLRQVQDLNGTVVAYEPSEGAVQATIPYSFAGREEVDMCSFRFIQDPPEVLFR
ncbi:hypothetical protein DUNSADRAFT_6044 [Dunaliella salina]|uniref:Uncharacterized protein n=1 Tax=Dunaliella salina TaxID=3046 RepID=A0ABQ7GP20_DUNSA|nr:hypothetical protein DUNSADRAFT_6044 [Dunaliella salina]|eukprot:KAF5836357.1 hypothetical protein DUNSADRAFT_6044 [Dunaliella salina]